MPFRYSRHLNMGKRKLLSSSGSQVTKAAGVSLIRRLKNISTVLASQASDSIERPQRTNKGTMFQTLEPITYFVMKGTDEKYSVEFAEGRTDEKLEQAKIQGPS